MRPVHWIVTAPAAVAAALFAVSNREHVSVGLWPLPDVLDAPLYLVVLLALVLGFLFGELVGVAHRRAHAAPRARAHAAHRRLGARACRDPGEPRPTAAAAAPHLPPISCAPTSGAER